MRAGSVAACGLALAMALPALAWAQASVPKVDVMHWWVSQGEQASIDVIRRYVRQAGMAWQQEARPGSGTARYGDFVRQRVEAAVKTLPFRHAGAVRPGFIEPGPGIRSQVRAYQLGVEVLRPVFPFFVKHWPSLFTTSGKLGRAMLRIVLGKADRFILEPVDINRVGEAPL